MTTPIVLVTGASGFIGRRIVARLTREALQVRAFVRATSDTDALEALGADIAVGDMQDRASLEVAMAGATHVIHAAADTTGTEEGGREITIEGTRSVLELCSAPMNRKLVYVSSCSVYGIADLEPGEPVDETSPLEARAKERGAYSWAKLEAERLVTDAMDKTGTPITCLRPGFVYGDGGELVTPMIGLGISSTFVLAFGPGSMLLPLVHVDNVADAVCAVLDTDTARGKVFNLVDPDTVSKRQYLDSFVRPRIPGLRVIYFPRALLGMTVAVQEMLFRLLRRPPILSRYRLASSQNPVRFDGTAITRSLGWQPPLQFADVAGSENAT